MNSITDMGCMFYECSSLIELPKEISEWKLDNVIDISNLFYGCKKMRFNIDFKKWNLSKVEDISGMFYGCENLKKIEQFSKIDNIKNVSFLFYNCINLNELPEKLDFNTDKLTQIKGMFYNCSFFFFWFFFDEFIYTIYFMLHIMINII